MRQFVLISISFFVICCQHPYKKGELLGIYSGNKTFEKDSIWLINDTVYRHFGISANGILFNDTGKWELHKKNGFFEPYTIGYFDFRFYNNVDQPGDETRQPSVFKYFHLTDILVSKGCVRLNISRQGDYFYQRVARKLQVNSKKQKVNCEKL